MRGDGPRPYMLLHASVSSSTKRWTSMSLSDLASLGSVVSGFAVLISLIYLALQVRQTERNQQISIRHSRVSRTVDLHMALADPIVAVAWLHGLGTPPELTQTELRAGPKTWPTRCGRVKSPHAWRNGLPMYLTCSGSA